MTAHRFVVPEPQPARDLAAEMDAFDAREHERFAAIERDRLRRLAVIARDTARPIVERCEAAIAGAGLRRVFWASSTPSGATIHPCDGKHVRTNRNAAQRLLLVLPRVGLAGTACGQDIIVSPTPHSAGPPSSGIRPLLAGDKAFQGLRWKALDAFDALTGSLGPGVMQLAGPPISPEMRRDLNDLANDLSTATLEPRKGAVPRVAAACAQAARDLAVACPSLEKEAWAAAEACLELGRYADEWTTKQSWSGA